jgi:hypothetical protein
MAARRTRMSDPPPGDSRVQETTADPQNDVCRPGAAAVPTRPPKPTDPSTAFTWGRGKEMKRAMQNSVHPVAGIYRHYKGQRYRVLGTARHSETLEPLVVYQALYGEHGLWVRPLAMFCETIERDGAPIARFELEQPDDMSVGNHPIQQSGMNP